MLDELGYLRPTGTGDDVTPAGRQLGRVYAEADLLVAECLRAGVWDGLDGPALAGAVSTLTVRSPRPEDPPVQQPAAALTPVIARTQELWGRLQERESEHGLASGGPPDVGFAWAAQRWAAGARLEGVLSGAEITAGDFVRNVRQLVDLLSQLALVAEGPLARAARSAVETLRRGVVSHVVA